jgi:hypothetical protein
MNKTDVSYPTSYSALNNVLQVLVASAQGILREDFIGAYLQGSFAVGDYDLHSDVDFIIVVEEELSGKQIQSLQVMHGRINDLDSPWAHHLEGSYFPKVVLRDHAQRGKDLWYLEHGSRSLIQSNHCNTLVVRWVVREKGVTLAGPPPATLVEPIPVEILREEIGEVITEWGSEILEHPERYNNRFYQSFIVLSYCRMLHDLYSGSVGLKRTGAAWAKAYLAPDWHGMIDRSWDGRPNPALSIKQSADPEDFESTLQFVHYVIEENRKKSSI